MNEELERILDAWTKPGTHPVFHLKWQDRLRKEWPVLAQALDAATKGRK